MKTRFHIPQSVQQNLNYKGKNLRSLSGYDLTFVFDNFKRLQRKGVPDVTVAIPAYNEENNLFATLRSLSLQQTTLNLEFIVADNNSSDRTAELAWKCGVTVVKERKQGVANARELALETAKGKIIVSCDADTIYPPQWLDKLVKPLLTSPETSTTYSLHCLYDETGKYPSSFYAYQYAKLLYTLMRTKKRGQLNCGGASMAFRTEQALRVGGYKTSLSRGEDGFLALQLSRFGKIAIVKSANAFIYTSNRRMLKDGSILNAFAIRAAYGMRHFFSFFSNQKIPTA
jgi:glycosyltransferase involved in cell wall biosynthesis